MFTLTLILLIPIVHSRMISYTTDGNICMSDCVPYNNQRYCWTGWGTWSYCDLGNKPALTYFTSMQSGNKLVRCTSECGTFGYSYNWCFTGESGKTDNCSPKEGVSIYGNICLGPCKRSKSNEYLCLVKTIETPVYVVADNPGIPLSHDKYEHCSVPPLNFSLFNEIDSISKNKFGKCEAENVGRKKRLSETVVKTFGVEELAARYERLYRNSQRNYNTGGSAVTSFVALQTPPRIDRLDELMTLVVRATIHPQHVQTVRNQGRERIRGYVNIRMENMDQCEGDERGHLLAASLGGPTHDFNFLPQSPLLNRAAGGTNYWFSVEQEIRETLTNNPGSRVEWTLLVTYGNLERSRRPTGFGLRYRAYNSNNLLIHDSGNCFFSNNPEGGCPI